MRESTDTSITNKNGSAKSVGLKSAVDPKLKFLSDLPYMWIGFKQKAISWQSYMFLGSAHHSNARQVNKRHEEIKLIEKNNGIICDYSPCS